MKYINIECKFLVTCTFFWSSLIFVAIWGNDDFFMPNNSHNEILHKFLVLMIYNTWLFQTDIFPKIFGSNSYVPARFSKVTVKNEKKFCVYIILGTRKTFGHHNLRRCPKTHLYLLPLHVWLPQAKATFYCYGVWLAWNWILVRKQANNDFESQKNLVCFQIYIRELHCLQECFRGRLSLWTLNTRTEHQFVMNL